MVVDMEGGRRSYVWGAVYVTEIVETIIFKRRYQRERLKREWEHSRGYTPLKILNETNYLKKI